MFNIVQRRYWYFLISAIILVPGLVAMALVAFNIWPLPLAIDFTGGAMYEIAFDNPEAVTEDGLRQVYLDTGLELPNVVQARDPETDEVRYQIRSKELTVGEKEAVTAALNERFGETAGNLEELRFESVGATVGALVTRNAALAVVMAAIGIMLYLSLAFHSVPHPFRYGMCAIIAMLHDVGIVVGLAAIMGNFFDGWEVDALFLTALLTVIGFSVHDSIVVFDRIRENVGRMRGVSFERVVNHSIIQTLDRSINTQLTAVFTLVAIFLYSEGQLKRFVFWLIVGIISGTYSSIFNAAPLLVVWENREWRNWFRRGRETAAA